MPIRETLMPIREFVQFCGEGFHVLLQCGDCCNGARGVECVAAIIEGGRVEDAGAVLVFNPQIRTSVNRCHEQRHEGEHCGSQHTPRPPSFTAGGRRARGAWTGAHGAARSGVAHQTPVGAAARLARGTPRRGVRAVDEQNKLLAALGADELTWAEVVGGRLYTGPLFVKYNGVLRGHVPALRARAEALCMGNQFTSVRHRHRDSHPRLASFC